MNLKIEKKILKSISRYLSFFFMVAFLVTCSTALFATLLSDSLNVKLNGDNLDIAAKLTFANVIILSLLFTIIDAIRRKLTVERAAKQIKNAASRLVKGDFSARVEPIKSIFVDDNLKEISRCFNKMAEELSGVETIRTDFISNVSHEMKTPLSVMQNYAMLLQSPELPDDKRMEYAKGIALGSKKLADMMTNILKLNRLENQKIYPKTSRYNLGEQLCECIINYETIWERKNIEIETNIEEDVYVYGDEELLTLVWNNLLSNAFKFTDDGGKVTITLEADEEKAIVRVKDTGCGISGDVGTRIFEKFYQADTARATSGNGLGLALVKRVIDILKGEIEVSSVVDEGTTFTVKLTKA